MKKLHRILAAMLAVVMLFALTACGNQSNSNTSGNGAPATSGNATDDTVYDLVFAFQEGPTSAAGMALQAWVDDMKEQSNGRLNITIAWSCALAAPPDEVSFVENGGADMTWSAVSINIGRFPFTEITNTPNMGITNSMQLTYAAHKMYAEMEQVKAEFDALNGKLVALHGNSMAILNTVGDPYDAVSDFEGKIIRANSSGYSSIMSQLGAAPMSCTAGEMYENISKNVMVGAVCDAINLIAQRTYEVVDSAMNYNFGTTFGFILMNWDSYNKLPADLQALIDGSYESLSYAMAESFNSNMRTLFGTTMPENNVAVYEPSAEVKAALDQAADELLHQPWIEAVGTDGTALLEQVRAYIAEAYEVYGAEYDWVS